MSQNSPEEADRSRRTPKSNQSSDSPDRLMKDLDGYIGKKRNESEVERPDINLDIYEKLTKLEAQAGKARAINPWLGFATMGLVAGIASFVGSYLHQAADPQPEPVSKNDSVLDRPVLPEPTILHQSFAASEVKSAISTLGSLPAKEHAKHLSKIFRSLPAISKADLQDLQSTVQDLINSGKLPKLSTERLRLLLKLNDFVSPIASESAVWSNNNASWILTRFVLDEAVSADRNETTAMELAIETLAEAMKLRAEADKTPRVDTPRSVEEIQQLYLNSDSFAKKASFYLNEASRQSDFGTSEVFSSLLDRSFSIQNDAHQQISKSAVQVAIQKVQEADELRQRAENELQTIKDSRNELEEQNRRAADLARQSIQKAFSEFRLAERHEALKPSDVGAKFAPSEVDWNDAGRLISSLQPTREVLGTLEDPGKLSNAELRQMADDVEDLKLRIVSWELSRARAGQIVVIEDPESATKRFSGIVTKGFNDFSPLISVGFDKLTEAVKNLKVTLPKEQIDELENRVSAEAQRRMESRFSEVPPVPQNWGLPRDSARNYFSAGLAMYRTCPNLYSVETAKYFGLAAHLKPRDPVYRYHLAIALFNNHELDEADRQVKAGVLLEKTYSNRSETARGLEHIQGETRRWLEQKKLHVFFPVLSERIRK